MNDQNERWLPIRGYEGLYEVSDMGRVRSLDRVCSDGKRRKGRILRQGDNSDGYLLAKLSHRGTVKTKTTHSLVAEAFIGRRPGKGQVNHINGKRADNRVDNLEWVSRSQNMLHAYRVLGSASNVGERNPNTKLDKLAVIEIRVAHAAGASYSELAERHGISGSHVRNIVTRENWKHIPESVCEEQSARGSG